MKKNVWKRISTSMLAVMVAMTMLLPATTLAASEPDQGDLSAPAEAVDVEGSSTPSDVTGIEEQINSDEEPDAAAEVSGTDQEDPNSSQDTESEEVTEPDESGDTEARPIEELTIPEENGDEERAPEMTKGTVTRIELGQRVAGTMGSNATKTFSFKTSSKYSYYDIKIVNSTMSSSLTATLYDRDMVQMDYDWAYKNGSATFAHRFNGNKLKPNSVYYVKLKSSSSGQYVIYVTEKKDDMSNVYGSARTIDTKAVYGSLEVRSDEDWMKFKAPLKGKYTLSVTNQSSQSYVNYKVYNRDVERFVSTTVWDNSKKSETLSLKKDQTIYISIEGGDAAKYIVKLTRIKSTNPMTVKASKRTIKAKTLKKKAVTVKPLTVKKAKGKVTYKKVNGSKRLSVNKKTGKITIKKGTKKGTYRIKVKVNSAGNTYYKAKSATRTVTVTVK